MHLTPGPHTLWSWSSRARILDLGASGVKCIPHLRGKGDVPASAGPDQRVRTSNPRLEFDCQHGFDVRVTPRDN